MKIFTFGKGKQAGIMLVISTSAEIGGTCKLYKNLQEINIITIG
jgi:hypothetical protein